MKKLFIKLILSTLLIAPTFVIAEEIIEEKTVYEVSPSKPPIEKEEIITKRPGPNYTWIRGRWKWEGKWVWVPGHWYSSPHPDAVWVPGRWISKPHGWIWIKGHWE